VRACVCVGVGAVSSSDRPHPCVPHTHSERAFACVDFLGRLSIPLGPLSLPSMSACVCVVQLDAEAWASVDTKASAAQRSALQKAEDEGAWGPPVSPPFLTHTHT
jgi:hypothetical protein